MPDILNMTSSDRRIIETSLRQNEFIHKYVSWPLYIALDCVAAWYVTFHYRHPLAVCHPARGGYNIQEQLR